MITQLQWWRQNAEPCYCSERVLEAVEASKHAAPRWVSHQMDFDSDPAPADHLITARVYGQLGARNHLLLLLLLLFPVVFHFILVFTPLLLLPITILSHPLRLLLVRCLLLLLLLQWPLGCQRRLCFIVRPCSIVQLMRLGVVMVLGKAVKNKVQL